MGDEYDEESATSTFGNAGTAQGWNQDDGCWELDLPFAFPFYGQTYDKVYVSDNGTIAFDGYFSQWSVNMNEFANTPMIAPFWTDLYSSSGDIFVESNDSYVTIRWKSTYYSNGPAVNFSAMLHRNGKIVLSYGEGNAQGGFIGVSSGDGSNYIISEKSESGSMSSTDDVVFAVAGSLPEGMTLSQDGVISGTTDTAGAYEFDVIVTDAQGVSARKTLAFTVEPNANTRPVIDETLPRAGYSNIGKAATMNLSVTAHDPESAALSYAWTVDGNDVPESGASYVYTRDAGDISIRTVRCTVSDGLWTSQVYAEWKIGELSISNPQSVTVNAGMNALLSVDATCALPSTISWYASGSNEFVGDGATLSLRNVQSAASYYAVAENALGAVTSAVATVTVDASPAVGRIYKTSGAPFVGNRLVLFASGYGEAPLSYAWKRDGVTVATTKTLDIAALSASDYGEYTLTVANAHGSVTSDAFAVAAPASGTVVGWGASDHGRTTTPAGLTDVVQMSSGMNHNLALTASGEVVAWGYNGYGQTTLPANLDNVASVAAGGFNDKGVSFAIKRDGSVDAWGQSYYMNGFWDSYWDDDLQEWVEYWFEFQTGDDLTQIPAEAFDVMAVAVGGADDEHYGFAIALNSDGTVAVWGSRNVNGTLEDPEDLTSIVAIAAGGFHALVLRADGTVVAWGADSWNDYGQMDVPVDLSDVVTIAAGYYYSIALRADGSVVIWGNWQEQPFDSAKVAYDFPRFTDIAVGDSAIIGLTTDGTVVELWSWSNNQGTTWYTEDIDANVADAIAITAGGYHYQAIVPDSDGDGTPDYIELELGRDPNNPADGGAYASLSGTVYGNDMPLPGAVVELRSASGYTYHSVATDWEGGYCIEPVIPGKYLIKVSAEGYADQWFDAQSHVDNANLYAVPAGIDVAACDFWLAAGESPAYVYVTSEPSGAEIYLDLQSTGLVTPALVDIGEIGPRNQWGEIMAPYVPHVINVKKSGLPIVEPQVVPAREAETVTMHFDFAEYRATPADTVTVVINSEPSGAEVYVDYADAPVGVTPIVVEHLTPYGEFYMGAASSASNMGHIILLKKDGFLRPQPVYLNASAGDVAQVDIPLVSDTVQNQISVSVQSPFENMQVFVDYLPTDKVTDVVINGLDPASHYASADDWNWRSASHNIMLRRADLRPFAPRQVPNLAGETVEMVITPAYGNNAYAPASHTVTFNLGAHGMRVGGGALVQTVPQGGAAIAPVVETATGWAFSGWDTHAFTNVSASITVNAIYEQTTTTSDVPVPHAWLDEYGLAGSGTAADYEAAAKALAANGKPVWQCYVAGLDPTDADAKFTARISFDANGNLVIEWEPDLGEERAYTIHGKADLYDEWTSPTNNASRFFKVGVEMP